MNVVADVADVADDVAEIAHVAANIAASGKALPNSITMLHCSKQVGACSFRSRTLVNSALLLSLHDSATVAACALSFPLSLLFLFFISLSRSVFHLLNIVPDVRSTVLSPSRIIALSLLFFCFFCFFV